MVNLQDRYWVMTPSGCWHKQRTIAGARFSAAKCAQATGLRTWIWDHQCGTVTQ